jgi:hypothetical protein
LSKNGEIIRHFFNKKIKINFFVEAEMTFKFQKKLGVMFFIAIFFLFSTSVASDEKGCREVEKFKKFKAAYPKTTRDYRGVVSIDANGGCSDELYCDFGANGLWVREGTIWTKLNAADPDWIIGFEYNGIEYLLCDFGAAGLWSWHYDFGLPGQFVKITSADPDNAFVTDDDGDGNDEVYINFVGNGLWRYDKGNATVLTKIHASGPDFYGSLRSDLWTAGHEEATLSYSSHGLWTVQDSGGSPVWNKINASGSGDDNVSADFNSSNAQEELIIDFPSNIGLWAFDGSTWHKLSGLGALDAVAANLPSNPDYENLVQFNGAMGLWMWSYSAGYPGVWTQISSNDPDFDGGFCEPFDPNDDGWEEVAVDFGSNGLWIYDYAAAINWKKINTSDPEFMVRSDLNCEGNDTVLVVDFGAGGLWLYFGKAGVWLKISDFSPDGVN